MTKTIVTRQINAPIDVVFATISDIRNFSEALPHIVGYEILTDIQVGVGTRFRETRLMNRKEATTELEVTEFVENDHVRMVAESGGTVWDTVFAVRTVGDGTELTLTMDARAQGLMSKLVNPMIKGMIQKVIEGDLDIVKSHCEARA